MNKHICLGVAVVAALTAGSTLYAQQKKTYFIDPSVPGWPVGRITGPSQIHCRVCNTYVATPPSVIGAFDPSRYSVSDKPNVQFPAVHWVPTLAPLISAENFAELRRREAIYGRQTEDAAYNLKMSALQSQQLLEDYERWAKEYNKPENIMKRQTEAINRQSDVIGSLKNDLEDIKRKLK